MLHNMAAASCWRKDLNEWLKLQVRPNALPVSSELAGDAQHVHRSLQLQLPTAYRRSDETARPTNPGAAGEEEEEHG